MKKVYILGAGVIFLFSQISLAAILNVPANYSTIQGAINAASNGDEVVVATGTYYERINFDGKAITVLSSDPNNSSVVSSTIINGGNIGSVVTFDSNETSDSVLRGFKLTNGKGTYTTVGYYSGYYGGGIFCSGASPTIKNNIITGNAPDYGGGIFCLNSNAIIVKNVINLNYAYVSGGGVYLKTSNAIFYDNILQNNTATDFGGGLYTSGAPITVRNCVMLDNHARYGAGMYAGGSGISILNCTMVNNSAYQIGGGGGLNRSSINQTISNCIFWGNQDGAGSDEIAQISSYENAMINYNCIQNFTGTFGGTGNISSDPRLTADNYHLTTTSWCINAGDPDYSLASGDKDIDGNSRIAIGQVDIGVDEFIGNAAPVAKGGPDRTSSPQFPPPIVEFDGSGSFDHEGSPITYTWTQIAGPTITLNNRFTAYPSFSPTIFGNYVFTLVVNDGTQNSLADQVSVNLINYKPVVDAGDDKWFKKITKSSIPLDGSESFDPEGYPVTYRWRQVEGPNAVIADPCSVTTSFVPNELGRYRFELTVNDGFQDGTDSVCIIIGSYIPISEAGSTRYAAAAAVKLDGSHSYDPDKSGTLHYTWTQKSGPTVAIVGANTAKPTVGPFTQTVSHQYCIFQLVVDDGVHVSEPDTVKVTIVPAPFEQNTLLLENPSFDPNKPVFVYFGGGYQFSNPGSLWLEKANVISSPSYHSQTSGGNYTYPHIGDDLVVYLSSVAPDYDKLIETSGYSGGGIPAMWIAYYINSTYNDPRYNVNQVSLFDAVIPAIFDYTTHFRLFLNSPVDGEVTRVGSYVSDYAEFEPKIFNFLFPGGNHGTAMNAYKNSLTQTQMTIFNHGVVGLTYWSVVGKGKNIQFAWDDANTYYAFNYTDANGTYFYDQANYPGRFPEPVTLLTPTTNGTVDPCGVILTCQPSENAVGYKLLFGPDPLHMTYLVSDTPNPPGETRLGDLPFENTYWTIKAYDQYGSTIFADPQKLNPFNAKNNRTGKRYGLIQDAINEAIVNDQIVIGKGRNDGNINFNGKNLVIRSENPLDSDVVTNTIISGDGTAPVVTFSNNDTVCVLNGVTITGGTKGILSSASCPTVSNCVIINNSLVGFEASDGRNRVYPIVKNCVIANNGGIGFNVVSRSMPTVTNCTITVNAAQGLYVAGAARITLSNSIIWNNTGGSISAEGAIVNASYSDIQGGFTGTGNINSDPCFGGDYHLKSQAGRWDNLSMEWVTDSVTSPCIDAGNPASDWASELWPNGGRINMGAFGGTPQASMSQSNIGNLCDLDGNGIVNFVDFAKFAAKYGLLQNLMPEDFSRDGSVDIADVAEFAQNWLWQQ